MTPEQGRLTQRGVAIVAAHLHGDVVGRDILVEQFVAGGEFQRLADAFTYAGIVAIDLAATALGQPFDAAIQEIVAQPDVKLVPGGTPPWPSAVRLAAAARTDNRAAAQVASTMEIQDAVNATFQLAVSAFSALEEVPELGDRSAADWATTVATGAAAGAGVQDDPDGGSG